MRSGGKGLASASASCAGAVSQVSRSSPVSITGWFLSNSKDNLRKYQITNTAPIPAGGFTVLYEYQFNNATTNAFTLKSAYDDEIWITAITDSVETG